jgi:PPM family protein phosphatase
VVSPERIYYLFETGVKSKQEDYIWPVAGKATVNNKVFIVCDGAGRFSNGGIASKLIGQYMAANVLKFSEQKMSLELIDKLMNEARHRLIMYAWKYRLDTELSTTFSMVILYNQKVFTSWCGDSRIYHLRGDEILFRSEEHSPDNEAKQNKNVFAQGIRAARSPMHIEAKWIQDVQDGDYFLLCSRGITENITDNEIKFLVGQNEKTNIDLADSFRRLAFEKRPDNYSMYLIKVNLATKKWSIGNGITVIRQQISNNLRPVLILATTIVGVFAIIWYFWKARIPTPKANPKNQTTRTVVAPHDDTVPSAFVVSLPRKPVPAAADSVKSNQENLLEAPQNNKLTAVQSDEKPERTDLKPTAQKKRVEELMIKLTTNESCKLKITNADLDQVIDWGLSPNDNGIIYLKPGKNSIVATSVLSNTKTKTYNFDVTPGQTHSPQNLHIKF